MVAAEAWERSNSIRCAVRANGLAITEPSRNVRDDVVVRTLVPPPPPRPIVAVLPAGYRSPAATAMLDVLHQVSDAWVRDRLEFAAA